MAGFYAYVESIANSQILSLERSEGHHLVRVLRARQGETVTLFDGKGKVALGTLSIEGKNASINVDSRKNICPPPVPPRTRMRHA